MAWFTDERQAWQVEFDKLNSVDFKELNIEKDKLENILEKLYEWRVIR
jgi:hypothetical protein